MNPIIVPSDPIRAVFTEDVVRRWRTARPTESLRDRLFALSASGPMPNDPDMVENVRFGRARKAAWDVYLEAAFACGLLAEPHGEDLMARLRDTNDDNFRGAMAECLAAWFLAGKLRLNVSARPTGKDDRPLELLVGVPGGDVHVEVKAPLREADYDAGARWVDDSDILARCLQDASKKFKNDARNLVMMVGRLTIPGNAHRRFFSKAFYADQRWAVSVDKETGEPVSSRIEYLPDGLFLKKWGNEGVRHTKVSGVLWVEESIKPYRFLGRDRCSIAFHDALVMHNPNAQCALPEEPWGDCPQFVRRGDDLLWTDGHRV
jgi:hypothetical protein